MRREQVLEVWSHPLGFWFFLATSGTFGELWGRKSFASLKSPSSTQPEPESQGWTCPVVFPRDAAGLDVSSQILVSPPQKPPGPCLPFPTSQLCCQPWPSWNFHGITQWPGLEGTLKLL